MVGLSGCPIPRSVTYDANEADSGAVPVDSTFYENGMTVTASNNTVNLARTGYTFTGWNTAANGSGTEQAEGSTFTMGSSEVTLYAQWSLIPWNGIKQIGTSVVDAATDVAVDSSWNAYVTGYTFGALTGANQGEVDIFLTKYNTGGDQQWIKQIGTSAGDNAEGVAVDSSDA